MWVVFGDQNFIYLFLLTLNFKLYLGDYSNVQEPGVCFLCFWSFAGLDHQVGVASKHFTQLSLCLSNMEYMLLEVVGRSEIFA